MSIASLLTRLDTLSREELEMILTIVKLKILSHNLDELRRLSRRLAKRCDLLESIFHADKLLNISRDAKQVIKEHGYCITSYVLDLPNCERTNIKIINKTRSNKLKNDHKRKSKSRSRPFYALSDIERVYTSTKRLITINLYYARQEQPAGDIIVIKNGCWEDWKLSEGKYYYENQPVYNLVDWPEEFPFYLD